jgi:tRNA U34 5-methylaminomethyl-2-thiouridine-forming methyltransferase MnmC
MTVGENAASLDWRDGVPVSRRWGDPYYSLADGLAETRHVFLKGNRLPERFAGARGFRVAELGFGTGLGFLAAWALWRRLAAPGAVLRYTAFEIAPLPREDMARALSAWPGLAPLAAELLAARRGAGVTELPGARLEVIGGDARETLPRWQGSAEAWFLDGFAPARNPEMWEPALLAAVAARMTPGGTLATYTAAGAVRRALAAAGVEVARRPGFGVKRHMSVGHLPADR